MLNRAARYFPILRVLKHHSLLPHCSILEIGSGSLGLGEFLQNSFVGCDISFATKPVANMRAITASGAALPFRNRSFDVTIACDVLEHIPTSIRSAVIQESLRVTEKLAIFAFPCGKVAHQGDERLLRLYLGNGLVPPDWLKEHMLYDFPEPHLFDDINGWDIKLYGNENIVMHRWMMRAETHRRFNSVTQACLRLAPRVIEVLLRSIDQQPHYRKMFVLRRTPPA